MLAAPFKLILDASVLFPLMTQSFPESMVCDFRSLIPPMPNQQQDRHVVAAAVRAGAQLILTMNLKDFEPLPSGIEAQDPEEFLCGLFDLKADGITKILEQQSKALRHPPLSVEKLLSSLKRHAPEFARSSSERRASKTVQDLGATHAWRKAKRGRS